MNAAVVAAHQNLKAPLPGQEASIYGNQVDSLLVQLDHYRRQTLWLALVNKLQGRLAGATDLPGMLEAFSLWLMPHVEHELVGFRNFDGSRKHVLCSSHGPLRRRMLEMADKFLVSPTSETASPCCWQDDFYGCRWTIELASDSGVLLLMRRAATIDQEGIDLLAGIVGILAEPLQRGLDYGDLFDQARRDFLTGLANRRVFDERIGPLLESARRYQQPLTLLSMDLDRFKLLNDSCGHAEGDRALCRVAETLAGMVRTCDLLVRMGGDEFLLVLPGSDAKAAKIMAQRIRSAVSALSFGEDRRKMGISVGIVQWAAGLSLDDWLQRADEALYRAKGLGCCCLEPLSKQEQDSRNSS
ncbi:GGDEF domain-containing protein [Desulfurivibrio alkaliphilus]|uniref:diguanylate cyclase n=1 Tax=Desulfurivibrio alkaliphilus (strain DSM 19089 / UNIQEM U267 / AHT2) TaxID=589865 RepID=D6Z5B8_DESAT|nr:GGDEF domain-containing protein [Desulfurivibrio alkaliphilus]ADH84775.1 diguanylate cyclase [Desulfurivibrio alkaliphilus AHT 2]